MVAPGHIELSPEATYRVYRESPDESTSVPILETREAAAAIESLAADLEGWP
jgi:hypothetical protein